MINKDSLLQSIVLLIYIFSIQQSAAYNGALFEPPDGLIYHGVGWGGDSQKQYMDLFGEDTKPLLYQSMIALPAGARQLTVVGLMKMLRPNHIDPDRQISELSINFSRDINSTDSLFVFTTQYDHYMDTLAQALILHDRPVFVRIAGEINGAWNGYSPWIAPLAFRKLARGLQDRGVTQAAFVWCYEPDAPTDFADSTSRGWKWYPGDDVVDWFSLDPFDFDHFDSTLPNEVRGELTKKGRMEQFLKFSRDHGKPIYLNEVTARGMDIPPDAKDPDQTRGKKIWGTWFEPFFRFLDLHPNIKALNYINLNWTPIGQYKTWGDARIEINTYIRERWVELLMGPRFLHTGTDVTFFEEAAQIQGRLNHIRNFVYQLQNIDLDAIGRTGFNLVIMDYSEDGSDEMAFTSGQIDALTASPGGEKIVLSYMSIGEAEDYRFYWQAGWKPGSPDWLDKTNPEWTGNYKVRYWNPEWQAIIMSYMDKLVTAGFDGVYLDLIDAYEFYEDQGREDAAFEMFRFVTQIAAYARRQDPDFIVLAQNGAELAAAFAEYPDVINGIGQEDLYYGYDEDGQATPAVVTQEMEADLHLCRDHKRIVLTVDYPFAESDEIPHFDTATQVKIDDAYERSKANGFVPYCTVRELGALTINPGHEPVTSGIINIAVRPNSFIPMQNFPNPFNPETVILYQLSAVGRVRLDIINVQGQVITTLVNESQQAGMYRILWNAANQASGIYFSRFISNGVIQSKKMALLR